MTSTSSTIAIHKSKKKKVKKAIEKQTNNAVIYIRVSTEEQAKKGYSLAGQEEACTKFAILERLEVVKIFREEGESAKSAKRTEFQKMLKYCKENKNDIKAVIFWKMERFMRFLKDQINVIDELESIGISVLSVTEPNNCGAAGNLTRNILGALAQYDNELKSERVTNAMKEAFKMGRFLWRAPFGYIQDKEIRNIRPKKGEYEIVKDIFEKFATGCYSQTEILIYLEKRGIKFKPNHLCAMLRNPLYCGYMIKDEWSDNPVKGTFKAIVSEKLFNKVQDILDGRKPIIAPHDFDNPAYPLKQFLLCPYCGKPLTGSTSTGRNKKKFYYYACYNKDCKQRYSIAKEVIENNFVNLLKNIKPKEDIIGLFKEIVKDVYNQQTSEIRSMNNKMQSELDKLLENKKRLLDFYMDDKIDEDMYNLKLSDILEHEKQIKSNLQCNVLTKDDFNTFLSSTLSIIKNIDKIWSNAALKVKKNLQHLIFPNGLNADFRSFQNNSISIIFKQISSLTEPYIDMVPPSEFESLSTP